jgi:hypothetical protein
MSYTSVRCCAFATNNLDMTHFYLGISQLFTCWEGSESNIEHVVLTTNGHLSERTMELPTKCVAMGLHAA